MNLEREIRQAEAQAWDAAARNKFWMFGYYAARVHYLRRLIGKAGRGPFYEVRVLAAQKVREGRVVRARRLD